MILHEGGNEVVAVIVAAVAAQLERNVGLSARTFQQFWAKLLVQERIGITYVDQEIRKSRPVLKQGDGIMLAPSARISAEIASERLDAPRNLGGRDNRRKGGRGAKRTGIGKRYRQPAMTAHRMAQDRFAGQIVRVFQGDLVRK